MNNWAIQLIRNLGLMSLTAVFLLSCSSGGGIKAPNSLDVELADADVTPGPGEFESLQKMYNNETIQESALQMNYVRMDAVRDTAMSLGARTALAWRGEQINKMLMAQHEHLNAVFNFNGLVLSNDILPPVLLESRNAMTIDNPQNIRVADRTYQIIKQAHFISTPPTWRDYLLMDTKRPEKPDATLLPSTNEEVVAWREGIIKGWQEGLKQAEIIYQENLGRLKRDYQGMVRYRMLLAQNMVSSPQVVHRDLGVTGGGESLAVNDRILTIKALPSLKANSETWKPSISP